MQNRCIIIGAGHAAAQLAPSLKQEGWQGSIVVVGAEAQPPYHRPPLSKTFLAGTKTIDQILIRPQAAYEKHGIELKPGVRATGIDRQTKTVQLDNGAALGYDKLALCTGSQARRLPLPGADLAGVHYLRTLADVEAIKANLADTRQVVIIGGGYIGLETAAVLRTLGLEVRVLEMMDRVLQRVTAAPVSAFYTRVHTEQGVTIETAKAVTALAGKQRVAAVHCEDGSHYAADLVIIGAGILPDVELAQAAGLQVDNGIVVDEYALTSDEDIVAAGDCTNHPNRLLDRRLRLESVPNATEQAKTAAATLCGKRKPYASHPWFWSDQYDMKLQIAGLNQGYDDVVLRGDPQNSRSFVAWYLKAGKLLAADCINRPKEFMLAKQMLAQGTRATSADLADETVDLKALVGEHPG
ncbi:pyridine nucleotide-disulfide oxidoreductase [Exilibacterium tricleocarpae]|uniref:Pyridine nucleotide-disulfide oxidoreductase n=1 Tax=Exilibacterium tricleocarpae TaxID=2591008 RepID=A0A545U3G1_9GAMM|nr:FAD-dependent oxidoreductase [Exilibacterium tricleocarpae]TQV84010.1 pyridine nucleotide-disulfide oxidoreductase [Exilibacterium tricleocarpae]